MTQTAPSESAARVRDRRVWCSWAVIGLTGVVLLAGCGSNAKVATSVPAADAPAQPAPSLVTARQVSAATPGSPQRAALEWWQAVQYGDSLTATSLTSPAAIASVHGSAEYRLIISNAGPSLLGFRPTETSRIGNGAVVRGMELEYAPPPSRRLIQEYPVSVILTKAGARWRVDDLSTLLKLYRFVTAQQRKTAG